LFASLPFEDLKPGVAVYHGRLSVLPILQKKGVAMRLLFEAFRCEHEVGYQDSYLITNISNALQLFKKIGGEVVAS
jgi:hypothetical protein